MIRNVSIGFLGQVPHFPLIPPLIRICFLFCFTEIKPMDSTTKPTTSTDSAQEINTQTTKESTIPTAAPKQPPKISKRDTLLRIKRQLALENELSSAADESENLGIEQVSLRRFNLKAIKFVLITFVL